MPILDQSNGAEFENAQNAASARYIFCDREILLVGGNLPDKNFYDAFVAAQKEAANLDRAIVELPQNYAAAKIAKKPEPSAGQNAAARPSLANTFGDGGTPLGQQCDFVPLREFCYKNSALAPAALRAKGILFWRDTYRHCPKCGAAFENDKKETALNCPACSFKLYPRIEPCVIVLISRGDEILLVKNKRASRDFYSCIAGFMELGESAVEAVKREVKEEVGLEIKNVTPVGSQSWPFPDQLMLAFTADWQSGGLVLQEEEIAEARWFKRDALPPLEMIRGSVAWNLINGKF